jgi:hypothetical protein
VTIRAKLYTAIVVAVAGLAVTAGVGIWAMARLGDRFDRVQSASDARAIALQLKFDVTDFNGWQTAYGYDGGESRSKYVAAFKRFRRHLAGAHRDLTQAHEGAILGRIAGAAADFDRLDVQAWSALRAGRRIEVKRLLLGPEIDNFHRAATAAQELATLEDVRATREERAFRDARHDALRLLILASVVTALFIVILLVTAVDLARTAERALDDARA